MNEEKKGKKKKNTELGIKHTSTCNKNECTSLEKILSIPLVCAEYDDFLLFSKAFSTNLCFILFPANLLCQLVFHPPLLHLAIYFLVYLSPLFFPKSYIILLCESYFFHSLYMSKPTPSLSKIVQ
jgi:hypothetical protein